jgi:hypothetical protein
MLGVVAGSAADEVELVICHHPAVTVTFTLAEADAFHAMFGRVLAAARRWRPAETVRDLLR